MKSYIFIVVLFLLAVSFGLAVNPACMQTPGETGMCRAYFKRYTYCETKGCYEFVYGGCPVNDNMFYTLEQCEETCGNNNTEN